MSRPTPEFIEMASLDFNETLKEVKKKASLFNSLTVFGAWCSHVSTCMATPVAPFLKKQLKAERVSSDLREDFFEKYLSGHNFDGSNRRTVPFGDRLGRFAHWVGITNLRNVSDILGEDCDTVTITTIFKMITECVPIDDELIKCVKRVAESFQISEEDEKEDQEDIDRPKINAFNRFIDAMDTLIYQMGQSEVFATDPHLLVKALVQEKKEQAKAAAEKRKQASVPPDEEKNGGSEAEPATDEISQQEKKAKVVDKEEEEEL